MRKFSTAILLLMLVCLRTQVNAQAGAYQFSAVSGTYTPVSASATTVPSVVADDAFSTASIPLGFSFTFAGTAYTSVYANSNGFLSFRSTATATAAQQRGNSAANVANVGPAVFPLWDDAIGYSASPASSVAAYEVTGTTGSRVFTFEWKNWVWYYTSTNVAATISFQAKLYEGTNTIEFVYQQEANASLNSPSATIGLGGSSATDYLTLSNSSAAPTASASTFTTSIATRPATGQIYRFTTPPPCVAPTAQPTALVLTSGGTTSINGSFTAATPTPDRYLVVRTTGNTAPAPANGTTYTTGTSAALGGYVEVAGTATNFSSTGLNPGTTYYYWVFSYNSQCSGGPVYNTATPLTVSASTGGAFISATSGNWNTGSTWVGGVVPGATDGVTIAASHTVTVTTNVVAATVNVRATGVLSVNSGVLTIGGSSAAGVSDSGTVNIAGGNIVLGATGSNNRRFTANNGGSLNVSNGNLTVYGSVLIANGASFSQSGGLITVDGNNAGSTTNSVATGTPIFAIGTSATPYTTGTISLTGGRILIVDPHAASAAYTDVPFYFASNVNVTASVNHTLQFGDGVSTDAGGSNGFQINAWETSAGFIPGALTLNSSSITSRIGTSTYAPFAVGGDFTITSGEWRNTSATRAYIFGKNITVNTGGTLVTGGILYLGNGTYDATAVTLTGGPTTNVQTISGAGTFANLTTSPTANVLGLTVDNTSGTPVTFSNSIAASGSLTLTNGVLNLGANTLTLGTSATAAGTYTYTAGYIQGKFKRWITTATGARGFNLGVASGIKTATIDFTAAPTTGGSLTTEWVASPEGTNGLPLTEGAINITQASSSGYWRVTAADGLAGGTYTGTFTPAGIYGVNDYTKLVLLKRANNTSPWVLDGTHVTATGSNAVPVISRTGMTGFSEFGIGSDNSNPLPVTLLTFIGNRAGAINKLAWTTATETNSAGFELERSADGRSFGKLAAVASNAANGNSTVALNYTFDDVKPFAGAGYYRLKQVDKDGRYNYSPVVLIKGAKTASLQITNFYPNPVVNQINLTIGAPAKDKVQILISDVNGKVVKLQTLNVAEGDNLTTINVSSLPAGSYVLKAICDAGCETETRAFIKQ
jgi:hypothetical protein